MLLTTIGLASVAIYYLGFARPYPVEAGLARPLTDFTQLTGSSFWPTVALIVALVALFALYPSGVWLCHRLERVRPVDGAATHSSGSSAARRRSLRAAWIIVVGFGAVGALVLLPAYPIFSLDIFYYMSADRIWSVYRENPFVVPPLQAAHDPFFPYVMWGHYALPYGPLWPWISAATSRFGSGQIIPTLLSFKALAVLGYVASVFALAWALRRVRPDRQLTGTCVFAWNPLVLLELAGNGHNDAVALVPAVLAMGFWARRTSIAATAALMASFLMKATVVVIAPALLWPSLRRAVVERRIPWWLLSHAVPALVLYILAWLPFWTDDRPTGFLREGNQYFQSLTSLLVAAIPLMWQAIGLRFIQVVLMGFFVVFCVSQLRSLAEEGTAALRAVWRIMLFFLLVVSPFFSAWYVIWLTLIAALIAERRATVLTTALCVGSLATYMVQFVVRPLAAPTLGLAQINALGLLTALAPFVASWVVLRWRDSAANEVTVPVKGSSG
ncbi:MAG: hypothetical protein GEU73_02685 [Chloroflexi bacterium]|nr:hypothetical protein [Chloroflexota bacterium]